MENFYLSFQLEVNKQTCPVHQMSPSIKIIDGQVEMKCCCIDFKIKCYKIIIEALTAYKIDYPLAKFKVKPILEVAYKRNLDEPV